MEDALGRTEIYTRDANGRVLERERADGSVIGFEYDAAGNLIAFTPPGRPAQQLTYTAGNLLESYAEI